MTKQECVSALKTLIVERLQLRIPPEAIHEEEPLFGEGLGLDSVESLELVVAIEERFGIVVQDTEDVKEAFYSVNTLADYVVSAAGQSLTGDPPR